MKRVVMPLSILVAVLAISAFAEAKAPVAQQKKLTPAVIQAIQMKKFGGVIQDTRQQKGKIVIVNAQSAADEKLLSGPARAIASGVRVTVELTKGEFNLAKPKIVGEATLFVVDDPALPMSLVAPEARWAMMNVASLKTDKPAFFEARVKKAVVRSFAYLTGAVDSQYAGSVMGCMTKPEDLDQVVSDKLPVDVQARLRRYLEGYGITHYKLVRYKDAVSQGWAPQPTNEYQKAVWDEVHTLPTKPMTIKYDKNKGE